MHKGHPEFSTALTPPLRTFPIPTTWPVTLFIYSPFERNVRENNVVVVCYVLACKFVVLASVRVAERGEAEWSIHTSQNNNLQATT